MRDGRSAVNAASRRLAAEQPLLVELLALATERTPVMLTRRRTQRRRRRHGVSPTAAWPLGHPSPSEAAPTPTPLRPKPMVSRRVRARAHPHGSKPPLQAD